MGDEASRRMVAPPSRTKTTKLVMVWFLGAGAVLRGAGWGLGAGFSAFFTSAGAAGAAGAAAGAFSSWAAAVSGVVPGLAGAGFSAVAGVSSPVSKAKPRSTAAGEGLTPAAASFSPSAGVPGVTGRGGWATGGAGFTGAETLLSAGTGASPDCPMRVLSRMSSRPRMMTARTIQRKILFMPVGSCAFGPDVRREVPGGRSRVAVHDARVTAAGQKAFRAGACHEAPYAGTAKLYMICAEWQDLPNPFTRRGLCASIGALCTKCPSHKASWT